MKVKIMDKHIDVSAETAIAIEALKTKKDREIKNLKDTLSAKDNKLQAVEDKLLATEKELDRLRDSSLLKDVINKIIEIDSEYKTDKDNPYEVMADFAKCDSEDKVYIEAYFDSFINAKIEAKNRQILDSKKKKSDTKIPKSYYRRDNE